MPRSCLQEESAADEPLAEVKEEDNADADADLDGQAVKDEEGDDENEAAVDEENEDPLAGIIKRAASRVYVQHPSDHTRDIFVDDVSSTPSIGTSLPEQLTTQGGKNLSTKAIFAVGRVYNEVLRNLCRHESV